MRDAGGAGVLAWAVAACLHARRPPTRPARPTETKPVAAQPLVASPGKAAANTGAPGNAPPRQLCAANANAKGNDSDDIVELMGSNAACCVCHMTFLKESMAKSHLKAKVGCVKCHGASANHANDEHIGATKPDIVYRRHQIDPSCVKCHEMHNAPAKDVIARFVERKLPTSPSPTCTECHGMHRIDRAVDAQAKQ